MAKVVINPAAVGRPESGTALAAEAISATLNAPTDKWSIANNGRTCLRFSNTHATQAGALTVVTPQKVDGLAVADREHTLAANRVSELIGPFPVEHYGAKLTITATAQATLQIAAVQF